MATTTTTAPARKTRFSRRVPDHVTDELVNVLSSQETYEFNQLFRLVYDNLKVKNAVNYIGAFEQTLAGEAKRHGADGVTPLLVGRADELARLQRELAANNQRLIGGARRNEVYA